MKVSHGELFSSSAIELSQCKFRGYKKSIKDFRRNLLLKTKYNNKNMKSQSSLHFTPRNKQRTDILQSIISTTSAPKNKQYSQKNVFTLETQNAESVYNCKNNIHQHLQFDKRMDEYLSVVFRKASMDTDKLMKAFQQKVNLSQEKQKNISSLQSNFMKKLKKNYNKLRIRRQRSEVKKQFDQDSQQEHTHNIINRLKKTQQFLHPNQMKINQHLQIMRQKANKTCKVSFNLLKNKSQKIAI